MRVVDVGADGFLDDVVENMGEVMTKAPASVEGGI
jgi:hypothetical protein